MEEIEITKIPNLFGFLFCWSNWIQSQQFITDNTSCNMYSQKSTSHSRIKLGTTEPLKFKSIKSLKGMQSLLEKSVCVCVCGCEQI